MDWIAEMRAGMEKMAKACAKNEDWTQCSKCPFDEFCTILMERSIEDGYADYDAYTPLNWLEVEKMRDPKRIDEFCDKLRAVWKENPDLRFGQLVMNIYQLTGNTSFFYLEDDVALQIMKDGTERSFYERD